MLPNGFRAGQLPRDYLSPPREQTLRHSTSLNPRQFVAHNHHYAPSPRPLDRERDRADHSVSQVGERMRMMKSKMGNLSIQSRNGLNENNLYPTQLIFLLSNEEGNVEHMRRLVEEEKGRVNRDFDNFSRQIMHMIEDLKLSLHSQLDFVFRDFIALYANLKNQVVRMRDNRKRIIEALAAQDYQYEPKPVIRNQTYTNINANNVSNLNLLQEISRDEDYFKNHRMYEEVTNAYFEAIGPIMADAQNILSIGSQLQFYKDEKCNHSLTQIRNSFFGSTRAIFENELDNLVVQTKEIIEDNNMLLKDLNMEEPKTERSIHHNYPSQDRFKPSTPTGNQNVISNINKKKRAETEANPYGFEPPTFKNNFYPQNEKSRGLRPSSSSENVKYRSRPQSQWSTRKKDFEVEKEKYTINTNVVHAKPQKFRTTKDEQNIIVQSSESPQFNRTSTINCTYAQDILLCILFINQGKQIAVGCKDKNIYVYSTAGKLLQTLSGHKASVCSLANFNTFFASGGDNGCSSLILWEASNWKMKRKVALHSAALTCIVDLLDGTHLATGGYDKKIHVYNYRKSESAFEVTSCRSGVTSLVICEQTKKLVSAGLDSTLTIWKIFTKNGELDTISFERIIINCGLPCSLRSLVLAPDLILVGNKDGKIMLVNVHTGETIRTLSVGRGSVIEMGVIQRHSKPQAPLVLSCSNGEHQMILTKADSGACETTRVRINIGFGCGIGPKLILDEPGYMAVVNQGSVEKEVTLYSLQPI